jgi:hypothetical protein
MSTTNRWVLIALALSGCAGRYGGWTENRTRHVTVYTEARLEHEYMQEWLERSYNAYRALFPGIDPGNVNAVWLLSQPGWLTRFFRPWDDPAHGWTLETVPSHARIGNDGLIVLERVDDFTMSRSGAVSFNYRRDHTLAKRQMAHLFVMRAVPLAPLWLQLGLVRFMSGYIVRYSGDRFMVCFPSLCFPEPIGITAGGRFFGTGRRALVSTEELFGTDWYQYDRRGRYWYEYTAYALVHYLIQGERGFNRNRFNLLLGALRAGKSTEEALALAYPHVLPDQWDEKLADHVRDPLGSRRRRIAEGPFAPGSLCLPIPTERDSDFKPRRTPADPREIEVLLEDLERVEPFRRHGNWMPTDVVEAEAAKRPRKGRGAESGGDGRGKPGDDNGVPTLRTGPGKPN